MPGLDTPPGAEKLFVTLRGVEIESGFPGLAGDAEAIRARLMGRRVSGADIFAAARDLEAAYAKAGYVLVRVTLPRQKLVNGAVLRLFVINGYIERVETKDLPDRVRSRIAAVVGPLIGVHGIMLAELERRILLAGDTPGVILSSALAPGSVTGATILVINAKYQPVNGILNADNTLSEALGHYQVGIGADFNSVFGFGELFYLRVTAAPEDGTNGFLSDYPRNRILAAGVIVPLGIDGLTFNAEGTIARTTPEAANGLQSTDQFRRLSARLRYPWIRRRNVNFSSQLVFDVQDEKDSILIEPDTLPLSLDRVRVLRVLNEADYLASWGGAFTASLTPSFGLNVLGARTAAEAAQTVIPLSVQDADATFAKLEGTLGYSQSLAEHLAVSLNGHAQTSFGSALVRSEQIGLAGPGALSAFDVGTLQGDSGVVGRAEISAPFVVPPILGPVGLTDVGLVALALRVRSGRRGVSAAPDRARNGAHHSGFLRRRRAARRRRGRHAVEWLGHLRIRSPSPLRWCARRQSADARLGATVLAQHQSAASCATSTRSTWDTRRLCHFTFGGRRLYASELR